MKKFHYAWIICIACVALQFCNIGLVSNTYSVYLPFLNSILGLTKTQASTTITIRCLFSLSGLFLVNPFLKKVGLRQGVSLAAGMAALAYAIFGLARNYALVCVAAALAGLAHGFGGMIPVCALIRRWFHAHDALAIGLCMAGSGLASIFAPPLITALVENISISAAFFAEAGLMGFCALLIFLLVRSDPSDLGLLPLGTKKEDPATSLPHSGIRLPRGEYLFILAACVLLGIISNTGFAHLSVLFTDAGFSSETVAWLLSLMGVIFTVCKCLCGGIIDRLGTYKANYWFYSAILVGYVCCCLAYQSGLVNLLICMLFFGFGFPITSVGLSTMARDFSDNEGYDRMMLSVQVAYMAGCIFTGSLPGMIADRTGSYLPAYILFLGMSIACMLILQLVYRRHPSQK